jgi:hypothetical protein
MKIVRVTTNQVLSYIPLKGWDTVAAALGTYAQGFTSGAKDTQDNLIGEVGRDSGGMGVGILLLATTKCAGESRHVGEILAEAKATLARCDEYRKSYDYDGMGTPFFKTTVYIRVLDRDQDIYGLALNAAYVGDEPEIGLAEHLNIPRTILSSSVDVETEILTGNRFSFDFEAILRKLDGVLDTKNISGTMIIEQMEKSDRLGDIKPIFTLHKTPEMEITMKPAQVERRFVRDRNSREDRDTWKFDGAVLYGELHDSYKDRTKKEPPTFAVCLANSQDSGYGHNANVPIWQPNKKEAIIDLTHRIAQAFM